MESTYTIDLSRGELHWLASSFGVTSLPIPDECWRRRSELDYGADLQAGNASLITRGLLRRSPDFGWQVDRLPSAIIQWLSSADSLLRVEYFFRNDSTRVIHILTSGERGLTVEIDTDTAHFTFYENNKTLVGSMLNLLGFPNAINQAQATYQIPQPGIFLPTAWKNPELVEKMLRPANISASVRDILKWIQSLEYAVVLSRVQLDGRRNKIIDQFSLCGKRSLIWGGGVENEKVTFVPVPNEEIVATMKLML